MTTALVAMNAGQSRVAATAEAHDWKVTSVAARDRPSYNDDHIVHEVAIVLEREVIENDEPLVMEVVAKWVNGRLAEASAHGLYVDRYAPGYEPEPGDPDSGLTYRQVENEGWGCGIRDGDMAFYLRISRVHDLLSFLADRGA